MYAYSARFFPSAPRMLFSLCVIVIALGVDTLLADALTPFTTTSCMQNGTAVPCPFGFPPPPTGNGVGYDILALGTPGIDVIMAANAETDSESGLNSASASISMDFFATTAGPVRAGSMTYGLHTDGDAGAGGTFGSFASISGVDSCSGMICNKSATIPFTLGVPFEIMMSASGSGAVGGFGGPDTGGGGSSEVIINLFDTSGAPVTILAPIPEPTHLGLAAAALFGAGILLRRRSIVS